MRGAQGDLDTAADCLLSLFGAVDPDEPTPRQRAGIQIVATMAADLHALVRSKTEKAD